MILSFPSCAWAGPATPRSPAVTIAATNIGRTAHTGSSFALFARLVYIGVHENHGASACHRAGGSGLHQSAARRRPAGLGRDGRRESRARRLQPSREPAQRGVGRERRPHLRRPQRNPRVPDHRRSGRPRHSRAVGAAAGARVRHRPHRLSAAGRRIRPTPSAGRSRSSPPTTCTSRRRRTRRGSTERGFAGGARRIRPDGSRCSSCPRTRARTRRTADRGRGRTRIRRSGSRSTSIGRRRRACYRGTIDVRDRPRAPAAPDRARGLRLRAARREQHARDAVLLERSGRTSITAGTSTRLITASRIVIASSSCRPTTRRPSRKPWGRFSGTDFTRRPRVTKGRAPASATSSRRAVLRSGQRFRRSRHAPGRAATPG